MWMGRDSPNVSGSGAAVTLLDTLCLIGQRSRAGWVTWRGEGIQEMTQNKRIALFGAAAVVLSGMALSRAQEAEETPGQTAAATAVEHPECSFFMRRDKFQATRLDSASGHRSALTADVAKRLSVASPDNSAKSFQQPDTFGTIDKYLYADMQAHGVAPADKTNDYEFIRRVTLDLTGRIPTTARLQTFVSDTSPNKRAALIEELLGSPAWLDKWTMYYGDFFQNSTTKTASGTPLFNE